MTETAAEYSVKRSGSEISVVGADLEKIPAELAKDYGWATSVDLSFNQIKEIGDISGFEKLRTLVLDNNALGSEQTAFAEVAPRMAALRLLSANNNEIDDVATFLDAVALVPHLEHLSLLKNPACPSPFFGADPAEYNRFRLYVVYRIPTLQFLDASPVTAKERTEAKRRGAFLKIARPKTTSPAPEDDEPIEAPVQAEQPDDDDMFAPLSQDITLPGERGPARYGMCSYVYHGKQSEGNRFILNDDL